MVCIFYASDWAFSCVLKKARKPVTFICRCSTLPVRLKPDVKPTLSSEANVILMIAVTILVFSGFIIFKEAFPDNFVPLSEISIDGSASTVLNSINTEYFSNPKTSWKLGRICLTREGWMGTLILSLSI